MLNTISDIWTVVQGLFWFLIIPLGVLAIYVFADSRFQQWYSGNSKIIKNTRQIAEHTKPRS